MLRYAFESSRKFIDFVLGIRQELGDPLFFEVFSAYYDETKKYEIRQKAHELQSVGIDFYENFFAYEKEFYELVIFPRLKTVFIKLKF